jgi:hypothetical protein
VDDRDELIAAYREFIREQTLRFERTVRELIKESRAEREATLAEIRADERKAMARHREAMAEIEDHRAETRAQTQALFRRLDGGAEPAM